MKKALFVFFASLSASCLFADQIGNVEYQFSTEGWEVVNEVNDEEMDGRLYGRTTEEGSEYFAVYRDQTYPHILPTAKEIQEGLQIPYPDHNVEVVVLDSDKTSLLYQWSISDESELVMQGVGRLFALNEGNISLTYLTPQSKKIETSVWVKLLKEAKESQKE